MIRYSTIFDRTLLSSSFKSPAFTIKKLIKIIRKSCAICCARRILIVIKISPYVCLIENIIRWRRGDFNFFLRDLGRNNGENIRKMAVDQKKMLSYNIFDKRAVGQCTPDRRIKLLTKNSA